MDDRNRERLVLESFVDAAIEYGQQIDLRAPGFAACVRAAESSL